MKILVRSTKSQGSQRIGARVPRYTQGIFQSSLAGETSCQVGDEMQPQAKDRSWEKQLTAIESMIEEELTRLAFKERERDRAWSREEQGYDGSKPLSTAELTDGPPLPQLKSNRFWIEGEVRPLADALEPSRKKPTGLKAFGKELLLVAGLVVIAYLAFWALTPLFFPPFQG